MENGTHYARICDHVTTERQKNRGPFLDLYRLAQWIKLATTHRTHSERGRFQAAQANRPDR